MTRTPLELGPQLGLGLRVQIRVSAHVAQVFER
jgi:hypothetical protein